MKQYYITFFKESWRLSILVFIFFCFSFQKINAQAGAYAFSTSTGASLTTMTGSTQILGTLQDDASSAVTNIGFTFTFACTSYTQFSASSNGLMGLGSSAVTSTYSNSIAS